MFRNGTGGNFNVTDKMTPVLIKFKACAFFYLENLPGIFIKNVAAGVREICLLLRLISVVPRLFSRLIIWLLRVGCVRNRDSAAF